MDTTTFSPTDQLREKLRRSPLTQVEIAAKTGLSQRCISDFLAGNGIKSASFDKIFLAFSQAKQGNSKESGTILE